MSLQSRHMHAHEVPGGERGVERHPGGRRERQNAPGLVVLAASHCQITGRSVPQSYGLEAQERQLPAGCKPDKTAEVVG